MRRKTKRLLSIVTLVALLSTGVIIIANSGSAPDFDISEEERSKAYNFLVNSLEESTFKHETTYIDFLANKNVKYNLKDSENAQTTFNTSNGENYGYNGDIHTIEYGQSVDYYVTVPTSGLYEIEVDFRVVGDTVLTNQTIGIMINDAYQYMEASTIDVPLYWEDSTKDFPLDSYGDETIPSSNRIDDWMSLKMFDNQYKSSTPLLFKLENGENKITIHSISSSGILALGNLKAKSPRNIVSYERYQNEIKSKYGEQSLQKSLYKINAIDYTEKNSSYVRLESEATPHVTPYSTKIRKLNVISGTSWAKAGQSITYEVETDVAGYYQLAFHYINDKNEYSAFRSVYIDGEIPYAELQNYAFPHTGNTWSNTTLEDNKGNPYKVYLSKGKHQITLKAEMEPATSLINDLQLIVDHINYFSLEILKVTGNDIDMDKDWQLTKYIANTENYLKAYDTLLKSIITKGKVYSDKGPDSSLLSYIQKAIVTLDDLMEDPDELPLYLENLYSGTSSINALVGESISSLSSQELSLDMMYVYAKTRLPKARKNFFVKLGSSTKILLDSFFSDKYKQTLDDEDPDVLTIWVNRPMTYIDIMQNMIDREFNGSGQKIKLAIMPDASKILLANAAGTTPDMAMGLGSHMPFDFAIRNAAYDMSRFDDFWQVIKDNRFAPGTLVSYVLDDKIYGLPETLDFNVMMYREDIFNSFGIDVPNTYTEMIGILPTLQRYGMNYYMQISATNATKWFYQTAPLIYQNGGRLYNANGTATAINSEAAVKGITQLTELFTKYSLSTQVNSFYNSFRNGTQPIGTASFSDYLMMKNAAPELNGKWQITLPIGTEQADGSINRTYISNGSASMIFADTNKAQRCWDFLKWWTSTEVQTEFGYTLQSTYGPEYLWLSCNLDAVANAPIDSKDKQVILEALEYIIDIPRTPGQYMLERGLSNVWTQVVLSGEPVRGSIDTAVIAINREITRKLNEFGYTEGYTVRERDWVEEMITQNAGK